MRLRLPAKEGDPTPRIDLGALKSHHLGDYLTRFVFGAGIAAMLGSVALVAVAVVACLTLTRFGLAIALALATATWFAVAGGLYVSILWLLRRRSRRGKIARPTTP